MPGSAAVGTDAHDGDGGLLAALAGDGGVDHAGTADGGVGDRMKALGELAGDAQRGGIAQAGGVANFDEAGAGLVGDAKGERAGAAHQHMGRVAGDQNGGQDVAEGA